MTRLALDRALPAQWIDEVFEQHRQRQCPRELLFSSVVELMTLVTLGLRPSLHAAVEISSTYETMMLTLPAEFLPCADDDPQQLLQRLLLLAVRLSRRQLATSKRAPKSSVPQGYVDARIARSHTSTDRVLKAAAVQRR